MSQKQPGCFYQVFESWSQSLARLPLCGTHMARSWYSLYLSIFWDEKKYGKLIDKATKCPRYWIRGARILTLVHTEMRLIPSSLGPTITNVPKAACCRSWSSLFHAPTTAAMASGGAMIKLLEPQSEPNGFRKDKSRWMNI